MILAEEPADARVVIPMSHQHKPRVCIRLAAVRAPKPERRASRRPADRRSEARKVFVGGLRLAAPVHRPQVAQAVVGVVAAHAVSVLRQARRVNRVAVGENIRAGRSAVADIRVAAGGVGLAYSEAKPIVGERIRGGRRARRGNADQAVFVIIGEANLHHDGLVVVKLIFSMPPPLKALPKLHPCLLISIEKAFKEIWL